jgi:hypothetical protein
MSLKKILVCSLLGAFFVFMLISKKESDSDDYAEMAYKIRNKVAENLSKRYNMKVIGLGGGMADAVNIVGIHFQIVGPLPKEELRRILVNSVKELLDGLNNDEKIRPYLKKYPFTSEGTNIAIFVVDKDGMDVFHPNIDVAGVYYSGKLHFNTTDRDNRFEYKTEEEESYEEALEIVKRQFGESL